MVIKGDVLTKQPRIYRKGTALFNRPVFEEVDDVAKRTLPIVIGGEGVQDLKSVMDCLISWKDVNPFDPEPNYYMACHYLITKNYTQFLALAEHYLFQKKTLDASTIMIRYYMFLLLKNKTPEKALKLILECVATYPLMAEFWCALGDLYLSQMKQPDKAYMFYENAIILGSRRLAEDTMPMEISKYDDYPSKMMEGIKQIYISADINATELRGE
jgi:tetratricopeptide (TPR) repeat protein